MKKTKEDLIKFANENRIYPRSYRIKINGVYIRKPVYKGFKSVWPSMSAVKCALQMIVGDGAYKEEINPIIEAYINEGFIEIVEI